MTLTLGGLTPAQRKPASADQDARREDRHRAPNLTKEQNKNKLAPRSIDS
ncbi:hypothetical protein [Tardiphaga robiniae]|nr:hypothetical protein [Tardiphaga robiniae]